MKKFLDNAGKPGKIERGCAIAWFPVSGSITISHNLRDTGSNVFHWGGDDKRLALFIRDAQDFKRFAEILGETHGLEIEIAHEGESYTFIRFV